jgi:acetoin utilization deacetylase AcuC-like enzyme
MATERVPVTGYTYDDVMLKHECPWAKHHHETPRRLSSILDRCRELKLFDRCLFVPAIEANEDDISLYHEKALIEKIAAAPWSDLEALKAFCQQFEDVYMNEVRHSSFESNDLICPLSISSHSRQQNWPSVVSFSCWTAS